MDICQPAVQLNKALEISAHASAKQEAANVVRAILFIV
jgi:hypothetical protein